MIFAPILIMAASVQDCGASQGALAQDKCWLAQSMQIDPPPNCKQSLTQLDMNVCSYRDFLRADIALNETWQTLVHKASEVELKRYLDAQRKWIAFRDAHCLAENGSREESGTIWPLQQNYCLQKLTEARTKQLRDDVETEN